MKKASHARRKASPAAGPWGAAAAVLRRKCRGSARLGLILGSGFQGVLEEMESRVEVPVSRLPGFPEPTVPGHRPTAFCGRLGDMQTIVLGGRVHYYEGHGMDAVTFGMRVLARAGVESILVTNAAGGLNPKFRVGDFMMLTDHINLMGVNPLRGVTPPGLAHFVDLTRAYDPGLQSLLRRAARRAKIPLRQGVYLAVSGPTYETPAEIRAFRRLGADAVGMSTVPEVIVARQEGVRVAGLSCITNLAAGIGEDPLTHEEVLETGVRVSREASRLIHQFATLYGND
jgi:purine-nucleoside phosphorylase